jgi:hypothetical protein
MMEQIVSIQTSVEFVTEKKQDLVFLMEIVIVLETF